MLAEGHKNSRQRGALFVEAALVIPFFIYLIINMIYFGMLLHDYMDLNNMTRNAVRYAVVEASGEISVVVDGNHYSLLVDKKPVLWLRDRKDLIGNVKDNKMIMIFYNRNGEIDCDVSSVEMQY